MHQYSRAKYIPAGWTRLKLTTNSQNISSDLSTPPKLYQRLLQPHKGSASELPTAINVQWHLLRVIGAVSVTPFLST